MEITIITHANKEQTFHASEFYTHDRELFLILSTTYEVKHFDLSTIKEIKVTHTMEFASNWSPRPTDYELRKELFDGRTTIKQWK